MSLDAPNAISGEPSPQTDNAHICDCVHRWNATKVVPFEYVYLLKYVWSISLWQNAHDVNEQCNDLLFLYLLWAYVIFVPFCVLFVYVCMCIFICVCLVVCAFTRARVCITPGSRIRRPEEGITASDDFLHTSSHGILHLGVVHSRYTWWGITFKVKELSAIWD